MPSKKAAKLPLPVKPVKPVKSVKPDKPVVPNKEGIQRALRFAIDRSFEHIEGREDLISIGERTDEIYGKFFELEPEDSRKAMYAWWAYLNKKCSLSDIQCVECRKGSLQMEHAPELDEEDGEAMISH